VINLDVVTRYYKVVTCRYNIIHILMVPCVTRRFTIQVGIMSTKKHRFQTQTADSGLHIQSQRPLKQKKVQCVSCSGSEFRIPWPGTFILWCARTASKYL